jgi:hypothetical protein
VGRAGHVSHLLTPPRRRPTFNHPLNCPPRLTWSRCVTRCWSPSARSSTRCPSSCASRRPTQRCSACSMRCPRHTSTTWSAPRGTCSTTGVCVCRGACGASRGCVWVCVCVQEMARRLLTHCRPCRRAPCHTHPRPFTTTATRSLKTRASLMYPPEQLAAACLCIAYGVIGVPPPRDKQGRSFCEYTRTPAVVLQGELRCAGERGGGGCAAGAGRHTGRGEGAALRPSTNQPEH